MKILVTGATGFIGRNLIPLLVSKGIPVVATSTNLKKAKTFNWFSQVEYIEYQIKSIEPKDLYTYFQKPTHLIHLAWEGLPNYSKPFHYETNLWNDYSFLKNIITHGLNHVTITGTCFEYGKQEGELVETQFTDPQNAYALAKDTLRKMLSDLSVTHPFQLKWARLFYMYGDGQSPNSLLAQLDHAIDQGLTTFNMSQGDQTRDYLPIEQVCNHLIKITQQSKITGIINLCSGTPISVYELVEQHLQKRKTQINLNRGYYPYSPHEPKHFWGNNQKLLSL
jgi:nucleoside-diphosphate-sugar epimerase